MDHFCKPIYTIVPGAEKDCPACKGLLDEKALEQRKKDARKRHDRGEYKRELWIPRPR